MLLLLSALAFFFLITGLILIHELGHFVAAKRAGVIVEEFGFGLPPSAKTLFVWRGTRFTLNWIPFGGFVRLKGESAMDEKERRAPGSFASKSVLARSIILVAGVAMNFILAFVIFCIGFSVGQWIPTYLKLEDMEAAAAHGEIHLQLGVLIDDVLADGSAAKAGVVAKSILLAIGNQAVTHADEVIAAQQDATSVQYRLLLPDGKTEQTLKVTVHEGKTGMYLRTIPRELSSPVHGLPLAIALSFREVGVVTSQTILGIATLFGSLVRHATVPAGVTGIVGIAQLTYATVQEGFMMYLRLVALLSLSLAVLNILPFPALDGGRLLFVLGELFHVRLSRRFEFVTNTLGFAFLLVLILFVTFYDVFRLFS